MKVLVLLLLIATIEVYGKKCKASTSPDVALKNAAKGLESDRFKEVIECIDVFETYEQDEKSTYEALHIKSIALIKLNKYERAQTTLERVLKNRYHTIEDLCNMGQVLALTDRKQTAVEMYAAAMSRAEQEGPGHVIFVYKEMAKTEKQIGLPIYAALHEAKAFELMGDFNSALLVYEEVLQNAPHDVSILKLYAKALFTAAQYAEGAVIADRVLQLAPTDAQFCYEMAQLLYTKKGASIKFMREAVKIQPNNPELLEFLGHLLYHHHCGGFHCDGELVEEAMSLWKRALALDPNNTKAVFSIIETSIVNGLFEDRIAIYDQALRIHDKVIADKKANPRSTAEIIPLSAYFHLDVTMNQLYKTVEAEANSLTVLSQQPVQVYKRISPTSKEERIRVAYFSSWMTQHPVGFCLHHGLKHHDRSKFEIFCINTANADDKSTERQQIMQHCEHFIEVTGRSDNDIANVIREAKIDILLDLNGIWEYHRIGALVSHPATIQAHYLAFPHSLTVPYMDYYIGDEMLIPQEARAYWKTEKLVLLNKPYLMPSHQGRFDPLKAPNLRQRKDFGLPEDKFIFASFNSVGKLTPELFDVWIRIINFVPNSVLLLRTPSSYGQKRLVEYAEKRGLEKDRIIWGSYANTKDEHLEFVRLVDAHLDSAPYGAHVTATDVLWSGVPLVTSIHSPKFTSRVAGSLLTELRIPELIGNSWQEYEDIAVRLATDKNFYKFIRNKVEQNRDATEAFDTRSWIKHFESSLEIMWENHLAGKPPRDIIMSKETPKSSVKDEL